MWMYCIIATSESLKLCMNALSFCETGLSMAQKSILSSESYKYYYLIITS